MSGGPWCSGQRTSGLHGGSRSILKPRFRGCLFLRRWQRLLLSNLRHATELRSVRIYHLRVAMSLTAQWDHASSGVERMYIQSPLTCMPCMVVTSYTWRGINMIRRARGLGVYLDLAKLALIAGPFGDGGLFRTDSTSGGTGRSGT